MFFLTSKTIKREIGTVVMRESLRMVASKHTSASVAGRFERWLPWLRSFKPNMRFKIYGLILGSIMQSYRLKLPISPEAKY